MVSTPLTLPQTDRATIYRDAKALIEEYGWRKTSLGDYTYGFCLVGAIGHALGYRWRDANGEDVQPIYDAVASFTGVPYNALYRSNDRRDRDWVLDRLDDLAAGVPWTWRYHEH